MFIRADVVGMTSVPEVVLAKELGICYASVGFIVNMGTGLEDSPFLNNNIEELLLTNKEKINNLFMEILSNQLNQNNCSCRNSNLSL